MGRLSRLLKSAFTKIVAPKPRLINFKNPNALKPLPGVRPPVRPTNQEQSQISKQLPSTTLKTAPSTELQSNNQPVIKHATGLIPPSKEEMERIRQRGFGKL